MSKIQRLNLELKSLDEETERIQDEIVSIKNSLKTIEEDIDREKSIIIDANSNEKRIKDERKELIEIDSKYYETEKQSNKDLDTSKNELDKILNKIRQCINDQKNSDAIILLDNINNIIGKYADSFSKNENIKKESIKRNERIKIIEKEVESWKNLLSNSEKMVNELNARKNKLQKKLEDLETQPQSQAEKKVKFLKI